MGKPMIMEIVTSWYSRFLGEKSNKYTRSNVYNEWSPEREITIHSSTRMEKSNARQKQRSNATYSQLRTWLVTYCLGTVWEWL